MTDDEFNSLCEAHSFGAVARGEFPLVSRGLLKALVDAAVAAERERCASICDALARVGDSRDSAACAAAIRGHAGPLVRPNVF